MSLTFEEKAVLDQEWANRVADITVATLAAARPKLLSLTPEQAARCRMVIAEEIFVRLALGDRPPG